ncbi:MAG: site-specific DNA-methyltransferase [Candidatus ainarchaeum sp.]|nr:site-specific DNA-methyltransferase [Candidatus ainarchaeum sp.]
MKEIPKMDLNSKDIKAENINRLKELFPEIVTEGKIDFDKLKLTLGEEIDLDKQKYGMIWSGKANCFKIIQDRTTGTLKPVREESVDFDTTKNLFIEGDNLEVLKILQKSYFEKIKMIYIDPPYNTGKDFVYKDKFGQQLEEYLKLTNQVDSEGKKLSTNTDSDGRYHSNWMNMMYPRLYLARNLLKEDGVIFISIDDHEVDNLKKICNEIFGEENFIDSIIWYKDDVNRKGSQFIKGIHEYVLVYAKSKQNILDNWKVKKKLTDSIKFENPDKDKRGEWFSANICADNYIEGRTKCFIVKSPSGKIWKRKWFKDEKEIRELISDNRIYFGSNGDNVPRLKIFKTEWEEQNTFTISVWTDVGGTGTGGEELVDLFQEAVFDYPKNTFLISKMIQISTKPSDIILDFFSGSATTAHAVMKLNSEDNGGRKFILVQLPEVVEEDSEAFKAGYKTISDIAKERIRRVIKKIKEEEKQKKLSEDNEQDLGFKVFKLDRSNFKTWDGFTKDIQTTLKDNIEQIKKSTDKEAILFEILLKEGFELTVPIKTFKIANKDVYSIQDNQLLICLEEKLDLDLFKELKKLDPTQVVVLDKGFNENDQLKTNAVELLTKVDNDTNRKEYLLKAI